MKSAYLSAFSPITIACVLAMTSGCASPPNVAKLQQMQANAQATVDVVCAGADALAGDLDKLTGTNVSNACLLAQQTAAAITAALNAAAVAAAASAASK